MEDQGQVVVSGCDNPTRRPKSIAELRRDAAHVERRPMDRASLIIRHVGVVIVELVPEFLLATGVRMFARLLAPARRPLAVRRGRVRLRVLDGETHLARDIEVVSELREAGGVHVVGQPLHRLDGFGQAVAQPG